MYFIRNSIRTLPKADPFHEYLTSQSVLDETAYLDLMKPTTSDQRFSVDASTLYLYHWAESIPEIQKYHSNPKIIILLRDPVTRAFSNYDYVKNMGLRSAEFFQETFEEELLREDEYVSAGFNSFLFYRRQGLYFEGVSQFKRSFKNVLVLFYEDLESAPQASFDQICRFLEIETQELQLKGRINSWVVPKSGIIKTLIYDDNFIKKLLRTLMNDSLRSSLAQYLKGRFSRDRTERLEMCLETRSQLASFFREDVEKLESLLGVKLRTWTTGKVSK